MRLTNTLELALDGLLRKVSRTFLTLLGITIGVAAVLVIASLGAGTSQLIENEISSLGADVIAVQPGREPKGPSDIASTLLADTLTFRDVEAVRKKENVPHALRVEPFVFVPDSISYGNDTHHPQIVGGNAEFYSEIFDIYPETGVMFGEDEVKEKAAVVVIGSKVAQELFGQTEPLGKKITIKEKKFRVVGVLPKAGQIAFAELDDAVLIPWSTAQTYLLGTTHFNEFIVQLDDPAFIAQTERDIEFTVRDTHDLDEGDDNDFVIRTPAALIEQVGAILSSLTVFLASVVAIALIVGGIGIMNIMLVSVSERTKEIGLRKAVGATNRDILFQFLFEAVLVTLFGGLLGIGIGTLLAFGGTAAIRAFTALAWPFVFPWSAAIGTLFFSSGIGLVFGLYPARKASHKSPMEALRYE